MMLVSRIFFFFCLQLAEKYFVKGGDPRAAIEMYTKANMYEAAHKVTGIELRFCLLVIHFVYLMKTYSKRLIKFDVLF